MNVRAAVDASLAFAEIALIIVADVPTAIATFSFGFAGVAHVIIFDVLAATPAFLGLAIVALVIVFDVFTTGVRVAAQHQ
ncbi:hypothetical protein K5E40_30300 [Pseudomonas baetica]|uniref:hypothetical protein n=1 Tax=Pseudomonas TaxID=286 RepID=UPI001C8B17DC|nr:hypothetical protein [Pseudomonas baetica]MBX9409937.1 hypothetical protein [Pseudomonas baetica]